MIIGIMLALFRDVHWAVCERRPASGGGGGGANAQNRANWIDHMNNICINKLRIRTLEPISANQNKGEWANVTIPSMLATQPNHI